MVDPGGPYRQRLGVAEGHGRAEPGTGDGQHRAGQIDPYHYSPPLAESQRHHARPYAKLKHGPPVLGQKTVDVGCVLVAAPLPASSLVVEGRDLIETADVGHMQKSAVRRAVTD